MRSTVTFLGAALLAACFAGCGTTSDSQKTDDGRGPSDFPGDVIIHNRDAFDFGGKSWPDEKLYQGVDEGMLKHKDGDVEFNPSDKDDAENFVKIAEWVKARRDVVNWCMKQNPQRLDQAIAILDKIVRKVPTATREKFLLGWYLYKRGSSFYDTEDKLAADVVVLDDEGKERDKEWRLREAERMQKYVERYQRAAIYHLTAYSDAVPMDKTPVDILWRAYVELQDFDNAKRWLSAQLDLMPDDHPKKKDCLVIKDEIDRYLALVTLKGSDFGKKPKFQGVSLVPDGAPPERR
jgi:hypothetical protein